MFIFDGCLVSSLTERGRESHGLWMVRNLGSVGEDEVSLQTLIPLKAPGENSIQFYVLRDYKVQKSSPLSVSHSQCSETALNPLGLSHMC